MEKIKVFVNLEKDIVTVQIIRKTKIFDNPARRFVLEGDHWGFSAIEKRKDGYYKVNFLYDSDVLGHPKNTGKYIEERKITEDEARRIIREAVRERLERPY